MKPRILLYAVVPWLTGLALVAGYFLAPEPAREIVAPLRNRELGLLENLENLLLLLTVGGCLLAARRETGAAPRVLLLLAATGAAFLLLEEIDYGHHFFSAIDVGNVHNVGKRTTWFRRAERIAVFLGFALLPLAAPRMRMPEWARALVPRRESLLTLAAGIAVAFLAERLRSAGFAANMGLERNLSEFEELFVYALGALWAGEQVARTRPAAAGR